MTISTVLNPRVASRLLVVLSCILAGASAASAQVARVSAIVPLLVRQTVGTPAIKGTDSAYDPVHQVYLVVASCYGGTCPALFGPVYGIFVNRLGAPVTGLFSIKPVGGGEGHFPRARFSAQANNGQGGFLVTWAEEVTGGNRLMARVVAYPNLLLSPVNQLSDASSNMWLESAAAIGYSPVSQRFLVAWRTYPPDGHVSARLVDLNGAGVEPVVRLSSGFGRDPGVAWNAQSNVFGVSFGAENAAGSAGFSSFAIVPPVNSAAFGRQSFNPIAGFTYITDVDYNPDTQRFVMAWYQAVTGVGPEVRVAEVDSAGTVVTTGLVSRSFAGYDAVSLAFNPVSRTFMLTGIPNTDEVVATELNRNGVRTSPLTTVGPGVVARYPRVSSGTHGAEWNVAFSDNFQVAKTLIIMSTSTNGGPDGTNVPTGTPPPAPGPPPPPAAPTGCPTVQPGANWTCSNGNWLPPGVGAPPPPPAAPAPPPPQAPPPSACPTVQPGPNWTCSNGNWLPPGVGAPPPPPAAPGPPPPQAPPPTGCPTVQPGPAWTCSNGNWLPPGVGVPAPPPPPAPVPAPSPTPSNCPTVQPGAGWTCVAGNWLPPGAGGGCTTVQPGLNWTCVNGGWVPPGFGCTTVQPGPAWTCVSGNWHPPALPEPEAELLSSAAVPYRALGDIDVDARYADRRDSAGRT